MRLAALALLVSAMPLGAQMTTGTIRGRVTDEESRQPLARVVVSIGGRSAITSAEGQYIISNVPAGGDSLRTRLIGYAPFAREVFVQGGQTLEADFALRARAVALAEMVVVGYGEQSAGNFTGAGTSLNRDEFNPGRVISPQNLIQNKVPGVQVVDNNEPGGGLAVRVRGPTSINASNEPLYVIDGVPLGTGAGGGLSAGRDPLNFLNPDDIENIMVLRDASAAAIYGTNAANGVVLITTRSGRGATAFEYTSSFSASSTTRLPAMLSASRYSALIDSLDPLPNWTINTANVGNLSTNWFDLVTRTGYGQDHNLAVAGQSGTMNYRLSFGYLNQSGVVRGTNLERLSLGINYNQRFLNDRITVRANMRGSRTIDDYTPGGVLSNAAQMGPTQPVYDTAASTGYYDWPGNILQSADNPVAILDQARSFGSTLRSVGTLATEYRVPFVTGLKATLNLGYDVTRVDRWTFTPSNLHSQTKSGEGGSIYRTSPYQTNTLLDAFMNYTPVLPALPGVLDITAGYSYSQSRADYSWLLARGLATDLLGENGIAGATSITNTPDPQDSRLISFFGRVNYNIGDRYLAAVTLRRDGSSRFGPENAWGTFPSVAVAWRISQEPFMRGFSRLSDLKLRASWARTGNQNFANYLYYVRYVPGDNSVQYPFGSEYVSTLRPNHVDKGLHWETTRSTNFGIDFGFMNQRFSGAIDWYVKNTDDLIFTITPPAGALSNQLTTNIGSMKNNGMEFSLNAQLLRSSNGRGLRWAADFTAAHNTNELVSINPFTGVAQTIRTGGIAGGVGSTIQVLTPGLPINSFFVYEHIREDGRPIFRDRGTLVGGVFRTDTLDGIVNDQDLYVDQNGDSVINFDDLRPFHDPAPKWIFGHSSYFRFNQWDASFTLRAYTGNYVYNNVASNLGTYLELTRGAPYNLHESVDETNFESPQYLSDYYVEDASFLRMDNITVGYTFNYRGQPARVFAAVQNAFTLAGYSGVDPTAGVNGIDNNMYPRARTFTGGMSIRF
jgi:iron complex outermembrane receptor protein